MTDINKERLTVDLNRRLGRELTCPLCNSPNLMVGQKVLELDIHVPMHENRHDFSTEAMAVAPVSCINCGHVMLFDTHMVDS
ncbi:MAG TPA: hypothetical protein VM425_06260 [Myxococcota bacterium]|nr:hypothetical protein [Myxococcota bacterium]